MRSPEFVSAVSADEPVSVLEARQHLRDPELTEDSEIQRLIKSARDVVQHKTGRILLTQTWDVYFDAFPCGYADGRGYNDLELPFAPLQSITSVKYLDSAGVLQTWGSGYVAVKSTPPRVRLVSGSTWPTAIAAADAVVVRAVFGYASPGQVPENIKHWMRLFIEEFDKNRGLTTERETFHASYADRLLDKYRVDFVI